MGNQKTYPNVMRNWGTEIMAPLTCASKPLVSSVSRGLLRRDGSRHLPSHSAKGEKHTPENNQLVLGQRFSHRQVVLMFSRDPGLFDLWSDMFNDRVGGFALVVEVEGLHLGGCSGERRWELAAKDGGGPPCQSCWTARVRPSYISIEVPCLVPCMFQKTHPSQVRERVMMPPARVVDLPDPGIPQTRIEDSWGGWQRVG